MLAERYKLSVLPDFCRKESLSFLLLYAQVVPLLLVLSDNTTPLTSLLLKLGALSLLTSGACLICAAIYCRIRDALAEYSASRQLWLSWWIVVIVALIYSQAVYWIFYVSGYPLPVDFFAFVARCVLVAALAGVLLVRYFYLVYRSQMTAQAESDAQIQALQARIRPHFLFNSLNSIAALIEIKPEAAVTTIEDLAELFRVTLAPRQKVMTVADELEVTEAYVRIEQQRLGERLQMVWRVDDAARAIELPLLTLQPLVENAVYHGIEQMPNGGQLTISATVADQTLTLEVVNPVYEFARKSSGNRVALDNIHQRLRLLYGEKAQLSTQRMGAQFVARIVLPVALQAIA